MSSCCGDGALDRVIAVPGKDGQPGKDGKDGVVDPSVLTVLDDPGLETDLVVVHDGEVRRSSWASFKSRIASWLENVEARLLNKTLVDPEVDGVLSVSHIQGEAASTLGARFKALRLVNPFASGKGGGEEGFTIAVRDDCNAEVRISVSGTAVDFEVIDANGSKTFNFWPAGDGALRLCPPTGKSAQIQTRNADLMLVPSTGIVRVAGPGTPFVSTCTQFLPTATSVGKVGQWATDKTNIYFYTGDGTTHSWGSVPLAPVTRMAVADEPVFESVADPVVVVDDPEAD